MAYKQSRNRNKRLKKLYMDTKHSYYAGAYYDSSKHRYIRYSIGDKKLKDSNTRKYRRKFNRIDDLGKSNLHKKYNEYFWIIY